MTKHQNDQQSPTIVIADDSEPTRALLRVLITTTGIGRVVGAAAEGREAVELVLAHSPEFALLDVEMPRMSGLAAAEVIATYRPATQVILHTGSDDPTIPAQARKLGIPLVRKITEPDMLSSVLVRERAPLPSGKPEHVAPLVLAALERQRQESVTVLDKGGNVVFYDSLAAEILDLPFPPRPVTLNELRTRLHHIGPDGAPRPVEKRPIFRVLSERRPIEEIVYTRRGEVTQAWRSRAVPLFDDAGSFAAAAIYWTALPSLSA